MWSKRINQWINHNVWNFMDVITLSTSTFLGKYCSILLLLKFNQPGVWMHQHNCNQVSPRTFFVLISPYYITFQSPFAKIHGVPKTQNVALYYTFVYKITVMTWRHSPIKIIAKTNNDSRADARDGSEDLDVVVPSFDAHGLAVFSCWNILANSFLWTYQSHLSH